MDRDGHRSSCFIRGGGHRSSCLIHGWKHPGEVAARGSARAIPVMAEYLFGMSAQGGRSYAGASQVWQLRWRPSALCSEWGWSHSTWLRLAAGHQSELAESEGGLRSRETSIPIITLQKYDKVFSEEPGTMEEFSAKLVVKPEARPHFHWACSVPYAIIRATEKELDHLEQTGVIEKVSHSELCTGGDRSPVPCFRHSELHLWETFYTSHWPPTLHHYLVTKDWCSTSGCC